MPITTNKRLMSTGAPKIDLGGCVFYAPLWRPNMVAKGGLIVNVTGICTGSPLYLAVGSNTVTVTQAGNFTVTMPEGGTVATGTMTVTASPVTIPAGIPTTVTTTGATGNITCTVSNIIRSNDIYNYACTVTGATWGSQGRILDGTDDRIDCGQASPLVIPGDVTQEVWLNITSLAGSQGIIASDRAYAKDAQYGIIVYSVPQSLSYESGNGTNFDFVNMNPAPPTGQWIHAVVTRKVTAIQWYLNGATRGSGTLSYTPRATLANTVLIGALLTSGSYYAFGGTIGEVRIYNRALSAGEVLNNYLATKWRYK